MNATLFDALQAACDEVGIVFKEVPADGQWHPTDVEGDRPDSGAGRIKLFLDEDGGVVYNWKWGEHKTFFANSAHFQSDEERIERDRKRQEAIRQAEAEAAADQARAAEKARQDWAKCLPASETHFYLRHKGVKPHGVRQKPQRSPGEIPDLVVPVQAGGVIQSLQFIRPDGEKRFLPGGKVAGGYFGIGSPKGAAVLCIAEGFATGASVHEATGYPVAVAFNAGNLMAVAKAMREKFSATTLILCADDDFQTDGNPGLTKAMEAAQAASGLLAIPDFGDAQREGATDFNDLARICGAEAVARAIANASEPPRDDHQPENQDASAGDPDGNGWPEPRPLPSDLPQVPPFDMALLPAALRPWIEDIAERMQVGPDIPAIGAVTALSAAIGRRVRIMPKAFDDWTVVPNVWGMVVAPPGYMKSPALAEAMKPLQRLQSEAFQEYECAMAAWAQGKAATEVRNRAYTQMAIAKVKKGDDGLPELLPEPEEPVATRYIVNNFSLEALGEVLMGNPNGVLAFGDELYGLLKMSEKPGNEGLRDFLLSAWNGDGAFIFDRIGRGLNRRIENVCVSILGGIQPGRLGEHIDQATQGGSGDSGLVQRFQLLTWPDLPTKWTLVDRKPDTAAQDLAYRVFERAVGRDPIRAFDDDSDADNAPDVRRFDPQAQAAFYGWMEQLEGELRSGHLPPVMASHQSKYRSLVPALALIFAIADDVQGPIPLRYVEQAIGWTEYLRPHAERAYACTTRPDTRHARALLAKIAAGEVADGFKPADVYRNGWSLLNSKGVEMATELLCGFGYLRRVETQPLGGAGGRPSISYRINPKVKEVQI